MELDLDRFAYGVHRLAHTKYELTIKTAGHELHAGFVIVTRDATFILIRTAMKTFADALRLFYAMARKDGLPCFRANYYTLERQYVEE